MNRAVASFLGLLSTAAVAAPTLTGGPRFTSASPSAAFSGYRSRFAVKADVSTERGDAAGATVFYDARTGAVPNRSLGALTLQFLESDTARLTGGTRTIAFEPIGWTESRSDGALTVNIAVFTLAHDVFAVVVDVTGVAAPLTVQARLGAIGPNVTGTATSQTNAVDLVIDSGEQRPFGVTLASADAASTSATSGTAYVATVARTLSTSGTAAFVLAFHSTAANSFTTATSAMTAAGSPTEWLPSAREAWQAHYASFAPPQDADTVRLEADARAIATLWHNEVGSDATNVVGAYPAKTAFSWFEVRDTGFHALAATNATSEVPVGLLQSASVRRRFGEGSTSPTYGILGVTDETSEMPAYAWVARALADRHEVSAEVLSSVVEKLQANTKWWRDHRDRDGDTVPELNGGLESGAPTSPRFSTLWPVVPEYPVVDADPRRRLNASDLSASLWHEYVEASRLASAAGNENMSLELLRRAGLLGEAIEDGVLGHWNESGRSYADYVLPNLETRELRESQTPAIWWPLVVGAARQPLRIEDVVERMLDADQFDTPFGLTSVAKAPSQGYAPEKPWSGAISPEQQWQSVIALYRYGWEAEAEALRVKLLDRITSEATAREHYRSDDGAGLGVAGFDTSAAVYVEALRNRHQAETFIVTRARNAKERTGAIRRMFNFDGYLYYEVEVPGTMELPVTRMTAKAQILRDEPTTIELSDPHGLIGDREFTLRFPRFASVRFARERSGAREELERTDDSGEGVSITAKVGDRIELRDIRFPGEGCGCGQNGGAGPLALALGLLVALRAGRTGRRNPARPAGR